MGVAAGIVACLLGQGCSSSDDSGGFSVHRRYTSCALGDFDGDGDKDLFLGQIAGEDDANDIIEETDDIFVNDGRGNFERDARWLPARSGGRTFGIVSAEAADFNGDGYLDLILSRVGPDQLSGAGLQLLMNQGDGTFMDASEGIVEEFDPTQWLTWATPADFDGDGLPDIAISANFGERALILRNLGDGTFVSHREHLDLINSDFAQLLHGDMDNDGRVDLVAVVANTVQSQIQVLANRSTGPGSIAWEASPPVFATVQGASGALLDWDGDDDLDLIATSFKWPPEASVDGVRLFRNDGDFTLTEAPPVMLVGGPSTTEHPRSYSVADFDGDGRSDLLIADHGLDQPPFAGFQNLLMIQRPEGGVADESMARLGARSGFTHCSCAGDIDNDDDIDLITCDLNADQESGVVISFNDGEGQFEEALLEVPRKTLD